MRLFNFISSLLPRIRKDEVVEDLRVTLGELNNNVIPAYEDAVRFFKDAKFKSEDNTGLNGIFFRNYTLKSSNRNNLIVEIETKLKNVRENLEMVRDMNESLLEEDVFKDGLSAKKAILVRSAEQLSFLTRYAVDLLNYVYVCETKATGGNAGELLKIQIQRVETNVVNFAHILSVFGEEAKAFNEFFDSMPDVVINDKTHAAISAVYTDDKIDPIGSKIALGFEGNPIYHLRIAIAEWQANRYKAAKDKKRMLELRLLNLKMLQESSQDPKIEQEIAYIQNRIESIEFKMAKMEQSVE